MGLYNCFNPTKVRLETTRQYIYAPCGKCVACANRRSYELADRVNRELRANAHNTAYFVTLTYDNEHLPLYSKLPTTYDPDTGEIMNDNVWVSNKGKYFDKYSVIDVDEDFPNGMQYYVPVGHRNEHCFAHLCYEDLLKFHSSLRGKLHYDFTYRVNTQNKSNAEKLSSANYEFIEREFKSKGIGYEEVKYRYFQTGEYGPVTMRPHYHILVWFQHSWNEQQSAYLCEIISSCWSLGSVQIKPVISDGVKNYLSSYVTSVSGLPDVLKLKPIRPFCTFSKKPAIGAIVARENEVSQALSRGAFKRTKYNPDTKEREDVVLPLTFYRRHFPKCRGFSTLSYERKLSIYSYVKRYFDALGIVHTPETVMNVRLRDIYFAKEEDISLGRREFRRKVIGCDGKERIEIDYQLFDPFTLSYKSVSREDYMGLASVEDSNVVKQPMSLTECIAEAELEQMREEFGRNRVDDGKVEKNDTDIEEWPYLDKYASLVCYRYCVLYGLTPSNVLDDFHRIYDNMALCKLSDFYKEQMEVFGDTNNDYVRFNRKIGK